MCATRCPPFSPFCPTFLLFSRLSKSCSPTAFNAGEIFSICWHFLVLQLLLLQPRAATENPFYAPQNRGAKRQKTTKKIERKYATKAGDQQGARKFLLCMLPAKCVLANCLKHSSSNSAVRQRYLDILLGQKKTEKKTEKNVGQQFWHKAKRGKFEIFVTNVIKCKHFNCKMQLQFH